MHLAEWNVAAGYADSVDLFQSTAGRSYAVQTVHWSRQLTADRGPGILRGSFTWGIEATPVFAQLTPSHLYGIGLAPVVWRWNFTPRTNWSMFGELSMGGLWTTEPIPEDTGRVELQRALGRRCAAVTARQERAARRLPLSAFLQRQPVQRQPRREQSRRLLGRLVSPLVTLPLRRRG